jgi:diguanylate cyclase (GGDEF)-like protein
MNGTIEELESHLASLEKDGKETAEKVGTLLDLGNLHVKERDFQKAIEYLQTTLKLAREINAAEYIYKAHEALSVAYEMTGDMGKALRHYKAFHHLRNAMRNMELTQAYKDLRELNLALQQADELKTKLLKQLKQQAEELKKQSREDSLTGLYNRRYLDFHLAQEFERAHRFNRDLTVAIADIDRFKRINDRFSHRVGDEVLKAVAGIFTGRCREIDIVARYGGEEFVLLLIEASVPEAVAACERIRRAVEEYDWEELHPDLQVTVSIGVSGDLTVENPEKLLAAADWKLYEAKRAGRNQVKY